MTVERVRANPALWADDVACSASSDFSGDGIAGGGVRDDFVNQEDLVLALVEIINHGVLDRYLGGISPGTQTDGPADQDLAGGNWGLSRGRSRGSGRSGSLRRGGSRRGGGCLSRGSGGRCSSAAGRQNHGSSNNEGYQNIQLLLHLFLLLKIRLVEGLKLNLNLNLIEQDGLCVLFMRGTHLLST